MKRLVFIFFLFFCAGFAVNAQTSETISELTPVPPRTGRLLKKLPKGINYGEPWVIEFDVKTDAVKLADGKTGIAVTIQTSIEELVFESVDDKPTARIKIYVRITSKDKTTAGFFEEKMIINGFSVTDLSEGGKHPVTLKKIFALPEGNYKIAVLISDLYGRGVKFVKFQI